METTIDKFEIKKHLGSGNFGDVFLCYDPFLKREIAVKIIKVPHPKRYVDAIKEGQTLDLCKQTHIVAVIDVRAQVFKGELVVMIVMEYLANGSVQNKIENQFISAKEACKIIQESLLGLEQAHNNNVLHRDIKPGNIMIGNSGESKLSDFGLSIDYHNDLSDTNGYRPHQPLEVIEGKPMDKLSDIYAMGITLYRLLNNIEKLPFTFSSMDDWKKAVKKDIFPPRIFLPHIPEKIIKILNKSIHKSKRYSNCKEFRQSLEKLHFKIDWIEVDEDNWAGEANDGSYTINRYRKKTGWVIDFKRNGIRNNDYCFKQLPDEFCDIEFYKTIRETTLLK